MSVKGKFKCHIAVRLTFVLFVNLSINRINIIYNIIKRQIVIRSNTIKRAFIQLPSLSIRHKCFDYLMRLTRVSFVGIQHVGLFI